MGQHYADLVLEKACVLLHVNVYYVNASHSFFTSVR